MSKLVRRKKEIGAAMIVALQLLTVTLVGLMLPIAGGPQQSANAPADSQITADQTQTENVQAPTMTDLSARRASAVPATKLYEPRASQIFNLATSRAESAQESAQQSVQESETPNEATLTTNLDDYPPYSYVYIDGTGFEPGETVNMIVLQLSPNPASYQPWDVVADENGNISTSWYIFSEELVGATMQATATGQTSGLTASATFTDNSAPLLYQDSLRTIRGDAFAWGDTVYLKGNLTGVSQNRCYKVDWVNPSGSVVQTGNVEPNALDVGTPPSFVVPSGPSGVWQVKLYEAGGNGACNTATFPGYPGSPDKTLSFDVARAVIIGAVATGGVGGDNWVSEQNPGSVQTGDLQIESKSGQNKRIFVRFNLTGAGITGTVDSALLRMQLVSAGSNFPRTHTANRVTTPAWLESTITWTNQPAFSAATDSQSAPRTPLPALIRWSVTSDVQGFINSSFVNNGWCIKDATENDSSNNNGSYKATEANTATDKTQGPVLLVDYSAASPTPTSTPTPTPTATSTPTSTPTATATFTPTPTPTPTCDPASVTLNPISQTVTYGTASVIFSATASGTPAPTVQWQVSTGGGPFADIGGATNTTLTILNPTVAMSGNQYRAVFTSSCAPGTATSTAATLTVNPAPLTITANNVSKTYGDTYTFDTTTPSTDFSVSGTLYFSDSVNSVTLSSAGTAATATFVAPGPTYAITVSNAVGTGLSNYAINYTAGTLTIDQASLAVAAHNVSKIYGDEYTFDTTTPSADFGVAGLKNSDTVASVALSSAGAAATATFVAPGPTYAITVSAASGTGLGNYIISYSPATLTITQAALTVAANNVSKTYGDAYTFDTATPSTDFSATGLKNSDTVDSVTLSSDGAAAAATFVAPGPTYAITIDDASGTGLGNYIISYTPATLTINQAPLSVTANNVSKTYGSIYTFDATTPSTDFSVTGLKNSDAVDTVELNSAGAAGTATFVAPGPTYAITVSDAIGTGLGNYIISYTPGTLTINQAPLTVHANNASKTYGDTYAFDTTTPSPDFSVTGTLYNGDTVDSITLSSAGEAASATFVAPGPTYAITVGGAAGAGIGNYMISYTPGTLTINQAPLTVAANNVSKIYGDTYTFDTTTPSTDFSVTGLKNSDTVGSVTLSSAGEAASATFVAPGPTYAITVGSASGTGLGNYIISYTPATLTISQASLTVTANNISKVYGNTYTFDTTTPSTDFSVTGLKNSDTVASVTLSSAGAAAAATFVAPGPIYTITVGGASGTGLGNYIISYTPGTLTITQATLTITATNRSKVFAATYVPDTTPPSVDLNTGGLVNSDTVTNVTLTCAGYAAAALPQPTPYTVTPSAAVGTGLGNYNIGYVNGQFTIGYGTCTGPNPSGVILQPIDADGSSIFPRAGRTVPVKFTVCDANGNPISDPNAVFAGTGGALTMLSAVRGQVPNPDESAFNDIPDVAFRYSSGIWIFNMATSNLQQNTTYTFRINLANGGSITFVIKIK